MKVARPTIVLGVLSLLMVATIPLAQAHPTDSKDHTVEIGIPYFPKTLQLDDTIGHLHKWKLEVSEGNGQNIAVYTYDPGLPD